MYICKKSVTMERKKEGFTNQRAIVLPEAIKKILVGIIHMPPDTIEPEDMVRNSTFLYIALRERAGIAFTVKDRKYAKTNSSLSKRAYHTFTPLQKTVHGVYIGCISLEKKVICLIHSTTNCIK